MELLDYIKSTLKNLLKFQVKVVDKLIEKIPSGKIDYRPCDHIGSYSMGEIITHMFEMMYAYSKATRQGYLKQEDFKELPPPGSSASIDDIKMYNDAVKKYFKETVENLTNDQLKQEITFHCWHGLKLNGQYSMMAIPEEIVHHRGQMTLYLRLMGVQLRVGFIYDYD